MDKSFDDIFNDFMGKGRDKDESPKKKKPSKKGLLDMDGLTEFDPKNLPDDLPPMVKNIIEALGGFKDITNKGGSDSRNEIDNISDELGEPDSEETSTDGDNTFNKKTWDTDFGSVTRISISGPMPPDGLDGDSIKDMLDGMFGPMGRGMGIPIGSRMAMKAPSLEDQLEVALAKDTVEGYEEAARLRIEIEKRDKKSKPSEKPDNTEKDEFDDFPF